MSPESNMHSSSEQTSGLLTSTDDMERTKKTKGKKRDVLEVEDDEQRLIRLQNLLESMNADSSQSTSRPTKLPPSQYLPSKPFPVPRSEAFSRLESFLPQIAQANAELLKQAENDPTSVNIENISDDQTSYIEMNLGLGVFEQRRRKTDTTDSDTDSNDEDETCLSDSSASDSTSSTESGTCSDISKASSESDVSSSSEASSSSRQEEYHC